VEPNAILSKLEKAAPGKILESARFGRADLFSVWIESDAVHAVAKAISEDPSLMLRWLENLSIAEIGDSFIASWFIRSRESDAQLVIRSSVLVPSTESGTVEMASVREIWPMAEPMENELAELFGIRFKTMSGVSLEIPKILLVDHSRFPMRKSAEEVSK
jgi:Ni,Fe-hydrogenase III component G